MDPWSSRAKPAAPVRRTSRLDGNPAEVARRNVSQMSLAGHTATVQAGNVIIGSNTGSTGTGSDGQAVSIQARLLPIVSSWLCIPAAPDQPSAPSSLALHYTISWQPDSMFNPTLLLGRRVCSR